MGQVCKGTLGPLCPFAPSPNPQPQKPRQCLPSAQITVALEVDIAERLKGVRAQLVEENMSHCPVTTLLLSSAFELLQAYTAFASIFPAIRSICEGVCVCVSVGGWASSFCVNSFRLGGLQLLTTVHATRLRALLVDLKEERLLRVLEALFHKMATRRLVLKCASERHKC